MGTLTIRNLPDELIRRVKTVAEYNRHSMEQEVRELLQRRYSPKDEVLARVRNRWDSIPAASADELEQWRDEGRH